MSISGGLDPFTLITDGLSPEAANNLRDQTGKCTRDLNHSGTLTLDYDTPQGAKAEHAPLMINVPAGNSGIAMNGNFLLNGSIISQPTLAGGVQATGGMPFINTTGAVIPAFALLRIIGILPVQTTFYFTVGKPNTVYQRFYFTNGSTMIGANERGFCYPPGVSAVLYNTARTPLLGESWGAVPSQWYVDRHQPGFEIFAPLDTSAGIVLAHQQRITESFGKLTQDLNQGGLATFKHRQFNPSTAAREDSTWDDDTLIDDLMKSGATAIASGKHVEIVWATISGGVRGWRLTEATCA